MTADPKEKTRIGGNRAGLFSKPLKGNALNEMYQKQNRSTRQIADRKTE